MHAIRREAEWESTFDTVLHVGTHMLREAAMKETEVKYTKKCESEKKVKDSAMEYKDTKAALEQTKCTTDGKNAKEASH